MGGTRPSGHGASDGAASGKAASGTGALDSAEAAHYNPGPATRPRQAAAVILLRDGPAGAEVLLVKRTPAARFMGGVWVFPGGSLEGRGELPESHRETAIRELREEAGVTLGQDDELVELARWITPAQVRTRFDTRFFLARLPDGQEPAVDGQECVELRWFAPRAALEAHGAGTLTLVFPTVKQLEQLRELAGEHSTVTGLLERARGRTIEPIEPRVLISGGEARVVLPGEPGYE
jgi:8-oxo-dGTP pyrophosphatase MutT (NUDIX family)